MANQTSTFGVDNSAYVTVTTLSRCKRVLVQENFDSDNPPTQNYLAQAPLGATGIRVAKGLPFIFTPPVGGGEFYEIGSKVGAIKTAAGSITMQQIESTQI